jgi:preprotein translocase subunit SecA
MTRRALRRGGVRGAYPERLTAPSSWLDELGERWGRAGAHALRLRAHPWSRLPDRVASHDAEFQDASDAALVSVADELRTALRERGFEDELVARSFALVRTLSERKLGLRHYDVQLIGGWVLLHGMAAEMETGEGKTLTATLPACTAALAGIPVHVITVNDYLARRDADAMGPLYRSLGLSVGVVVSGMDPASRRAAYGADLTYATNKELVFDYLKDRIALGRRASQLRLQLQRLGVDRSAAPGLLHRGLHFAIVDEADSVLIDEARTPLIISGKGRDASQEEVFRTAVRLARELERYVDFEVDEQERRVRLLPPGVEALEALGAEAGGIFRGERRREELVCLALAALHCFRRDHHYLVKDDKVQIVDEFTGRVMEDRSWERGLHQMIEAAEKLPISVRPETLARISYQRFFQRYLRLAGMTGTAREVAGELQAVYGLSVVRVPPRRKLRRRNLGQRVLRRAEDKWRCIAERIAEVHATGRPILVGTRSVEASERLSERLDKLGISHRVLNARQDREEAEIVAEAGEVGRVTVATNMAGRGTDIRLGEGVAERGGLHVIATERHEAARIDRQLFGRCGRQGDPGSAEALVSLDDELFAHHAGSLSRWLAALGEGREKTRGGRAALELAVQLAQRAAERLHGQMRRDLLRHDQQLDRLLAFSGRFE